MPVGKCGGKEQVEDGQSGDTQSVRSLCVCRFFLFELYFLSAFLVFGLLRRPECELTLPHTNLCIRLKDFDIMWLYSPLHTAVDRKPPLQSRQLL